jgi:DtxR family transcriptional regulator, Mn-dependent transcriptional regulator
MSARVSPAAQDYLKAIFIEAEEWGSAATSRIAARLSVSAASATNMLKRLAAEGLVDHSPYRGARLTVPGRAAALEVIRHHRLLETYLAEALGVPWDEVHKEAEVLEHVLSEALEVRISERLGHPSADPHGHPIPNSKLEMPGASNRRLWDVNEGAVIVERVSDAHPEALRYLDELGLRPGAKVEVLRKGPMGGPLFVRIGQEEHAVSMNLAEVIWVS